VEEIPESEKKNIHLLCVDDDVFTSKYINFILNKDYILSFAVDGKSALEMAKSHTFSLILMDINLGKGMDGVETTRKIRKLPGYEKVPVIAMTAFAMKGDREDLLNDGMDDYISKPFKTLELKKIINTVLSKSNI
jgi:CheY-like chemotaxis protein